MPHRPAVARFSVWLCRPLLAAIALAFAGAGKEPPPRPLYEDHSRLLVYADESGRQRPVKTPDDWARRRKHVLAGMQQAMGELPSRAELPPLHVKVDEEVRAAGHTRLKLSFVAEKRQDGKVDRIPAYLLLPEPRPAGERLPAMLALHQTTPKGKAEPAGIDNKANRDCGLELVKRGYVVLCPDYPSFGDYEYDFGADRYASGSMKGVFNHMRCADFLRSRPDVDGDRIGVIGHSLGGHNAMFVAAFDERLKVIVSSCGWTPFADYMGGKIAGWTSDRYMPRLKDVYGLDPKRVPFDFYEVVAALAPRPFFSNSPLHDGNFSAEGVKKATAAAKEVYQLLGAPDALRVVHPDSGHDFPPEVRKQAYAFIDAALKHTPLPDNARVGSGAPPPSPLYSGKRARGEGPGPKQQASAPHPDPLPGLPGRGDDPPGDFADELPRIAPKEPADALSTFKTLPGFRVEQVAAEPLVHSPVALDFDENGRMFVVEMIDYSEQATEHLGTVRVLEDADGDGRFDKSTVYADRLSWPTAVLCYDGGVFVGAAPDVHYLKDTDGDGKADVRNTVFTGFGRQNVQGLLNSFRWGIDNRVHGATSTNGGRITRPDTPDWKPVDLGGRDFSFDPRTLDLRAESGGGQHGMSFDDFGRKFVSSNSDHLQMVMFEDRYVARNPLLAAPPARVSIAADGPQAKVFRVSPIEPWRIVRTRLRVSGQAPGPIEGGGQPAGYFTGATGVTVYRGDAFPPEYRGQAFVGDVGSNLVHRKVLAPSGAGFVGRRVDEGKEFLASTDTWFRPAQFANAPDGCLYVIDVYREVIEHPASLPPQIKKHLDLTSGRDRGRIYRVVPEGFKQRPLPKLGEATTEQVVATLEHRNGWHRDTAARLLYQWQDPAAIGHLEAMPYESKVPEARVHALYALASQGRLSPEVLLRGLGDEHPRVREHAVRLAEPFAGESQPLRDKLLALADDPDPRVRYQLAFTLGEVPRLQPQRDAALAKLLRRDPADRWLRLAVQSSLADGAAAVLAELAGDATFAATREGSDVLRQLATQAGARGRQDEVAAAVRAIEALAVENEPAANALLTALSQGLVRGGSPLRDRLPAGSKAGKLLAELVSEAKRTAADARRRPSHRAEAVRTLALAPAAEARELLTDLLKGNHPQEVQLAAVAALDRFTDPQIGTVLVDAWRGLSPRLRAAAADAIFSRPERVAAFLDAVESGKIPAADLDAGRLKVLRQSDNPAVRQKAEKLSARFKTGARPDVLEAYRPALNLKGDPAKGKAVFQKTCAACHRLDNFGTEIGPNLVAMQNRGPEAILSNVIDPNLEVNPQFVEYLVDTKDGRTLTGLLASETANSVTLKRSEGATDTVLRGDITKMRSTGLSIMPEGLEQQLDVQAMADLIAYLMSVK